MGSKAGVEVAGECSHGNTWGCTDCSQTRTRRQMCFWCERWA